MKRTYLVAALVEYTVETDVPDGEDDEHALDVAMEAKQNALAEMGVSVGSIENVEPR